MVKRLLIILLFNSCCATQLNYINKKLLPIALGKSKLQYFFSPKVNCGDLFTNISQIETKKIELAAFYLTCPKIINILSTLAKKDIDIDIIIDPTSIKYKKEEIEKLIRSGAICRVYCPKNKELMHNKFAVFHSSFNNKALVWTGSANFTFNATKNRENIIILQDKKLAKSYSKEFDKLKEKTLTFKG